MLKSLRKIHTNNSGVIMITVLVLVLVMSVVAIGVLGINISQVSTSASVIDNIKAEQLAIGAFYQYHQRMLDANGVAPPPEVIDGKTYNVSILNKGNAGTPNNVDQIEVTVDFGN